MQDAARAPVRSAADHPRLLDDLVPDVLVVEKAFFSNNRNSALLNVFADEIRSIGRRKGLTVASFAPSTVKKAVCGDGRAPEAEVANIVASKYPELKLFLSQDRKWKKRHHGNMFDAVALGLTMRTGRKKVGWNRRHTSLIKTHQLGETFGLKMKRKWPLRSNR